MLTLTSIKPENHIRFKSVPVYEQKITGEMKYALIKQVGAIKSAVIDILTKAKNNTLNQKSKALLEKFNIKISDGIEIASILGIGSVITFFINKAKDGSENLGITIKQPEKNNSTYIFDKNNVLKVNQRNSKYLTEKELNNIKFQSLITEILEKVDGPLLQIRLAELPPAKPYIPEFKPKIKKDAKKIEPKIETPTIEELNLELEKQNNAKVGIKKKQFKNASEAYQYIQELEAQGRRDTSVEIDLMLGKFPYEAEENKRPNITSNTIIERKNEIKEITIDEIETPSETISEQKNIFKKETDPIEDTISLFITKATEPKSQKEVYKKTNFFFRTINRIIDFFKI